MPPLLSIRRASEEGPGPAPLPAKLPSTADRWHPPHFAGVVFLTWLRIERTPLSPHPESCPNVPRGQEEGGAPRASPGPRQAGPGRAAAGGDDVRLGEVHPVPGAVAGDGGRGGAAAVPSAVLLLGQHRGLSRAGAAQCPEEHPPQCREAVSNPARVVASPLRLPLGLPSAGVAEVVRGASRIWDPDALWEGGFPFPSTAAGGARSTAMRGDTGEVEAAPGRCLSSWSAAVRSAVPAAAVSGGGRAGNTVAPGAPGGGSGGASPPAGSSSPANFAYCGLLFPKCRGRRAGPRRPAVFRESRQARG